ncbi:MAG: DnaJ domain-containing protein [Methylocystis sp.]|nr:DnaJ domain-containing protein [Methylocystis sp.]MBI3275283.1 DnaJ domain-containing protein [Methylocystis sp.]
MSGATALRVAIDLVLMPSRVRTLKAEPLPEGVPFLLRIAAGDGEAAREAAELTGKPPETVNAAAAFFIEQILLNSESNSYRVLGARRNATGAELRRNMALLLKWLHPDLDQNAERSIFARRVTGAWDNLKTPERRAVYDMARNARQTERQARRAGQSGGSSIVPYDRDETRYPRAVTAGKMREPSKMIGAHGRKRDSLLRRALLRLLGRREH